MVGSTLLQRPLPPVICRQAFSGPTTLTAHFLGVPTVLLPRPGPQLSGRWGHPAASLPAAPQHEFQEGRVSGGGHGETEEGAHCLLSGLPG